MQEKIGIIGYGHMGAAIAKQLKTYYQIFVFDKDKNKTSTDPGILVAADLVGLAENAEVLFLAVKPQDLDAVLKSLRNYTKDKLIISIAAGISTRHLERFLGEVRTVRAMPNIGIKIAESVTCLSKGHFANDEDLELAQELFYYLGATRVIDEKMLNAATAISGSGPAYIFYFLEQNSLDPKNIAEHTRHDITKRLAQAAQAVGFNHEDAMFLAINTVNASLSLLKNLHLTPAELRAEVTSKGGTTEAALVVLKRSDSWDDAAQAALKRAEDLARRD